MSHEIVYKGVLASTKLGSVDTTGIDLPWGTEVVISEQNGYSYIAFCAVLENGEIAIRDAIARFVEAKPCATGLIMCYGPTPYNIRQIEVREGRMYEKLATVEYEEPGRVIWLTPRQ